MAASDHKVRLVLRSRDPDLLLEAKNLLQKRIEP
jgi:hypothetical protein